jgi:hypothetical protein
MNYCIHDFMKPCRRDQTPHIATAPRSGSCRDSDAKQSRGEKRAAPPPNAPGTAPSSHPVGRSAAFVGLSRATRGYPVGRSAYYY